MNGLGTSFFSRAFQGQFPEIWNSFPREIPSSWRHESHFLMAESSSNRKGESSRFDKKGFLAPSWVNLRRSQTPALERWGMCALVEQMISNVLHYSLIHDDDQNWIQHLNVIVCLGTVIPHKMCAWWVGVNVNRSPQKGCAFVGTKHFFKKRTNPLVR